MLLQDRFSFFSLFCVFCSPQQVRGGIDSKPEAGSVAGFERTGFRVQSWFEPSSKLENPLLSLAIIDRYYCFKSSRVCGLLLFGGYRRH